MWTFVRRKPLGAAGGLVLAGMLALALLAERVTPYSESLSMPWVTGAWNLQDLRGLAALSREMARQAAMIGYLDAFVFFVVTALAVLPLVLLIRVKR